MSTLDSAFDRIKNAVSSAGLDAEGAVSDPFERIANAVASAQPGAAPGAAAGEQDLQRIAAADYQNELVIPEVLPMLPEALRFPSIQAEPREVERGLRQTMAQAAQAIATPGLRAKFFESVLDPWFAIAAPYARPMAPVMGRLASQALEPSGSGLTVDDLRTEQIAARGAAEGMAAGQQQGVTGDVARAIGQTLPQFAGVAGAIATGGAGLPVVAANIASQATLPLSAWTGGQLAYLDEIDAKRAQEALEGKELSQYSVDEMQRRATASAMIQTGTEVVGAGLAGRAIGTIGAKMVGSKVGRSALGALSERGAPIVQKAMASKAGQAGAEAFARVSQGTMRFRNGFFGDAARLVATSAAEEGAEELGAAILEAPFTEAPLSKDLSDGLYSAFIGSLAGGIGGGVGVTGAVAGRAIKNRQDAFRPETDAEIRLRQLHSDAMKARTNWTEELDDTQQAEVAVALNNLNGMNQEERGIFLRELSDRRAQIRAKVESLLAHRQDLDAALAPALEAQRTFEAGAQNREAQQAVIAEAQAALDRAEADYQAARDALAEMELAQEQAGVPRVARRGRKIVTPAQRQQAVTDAQALVNEATRALQSARADADVAVGLELSPGQSIDPTEAVDDIRRQVEETDAELRMLTNDHMIANATYAAVSEKLSDMPMDVMQRESDEVLSNLGKSVGVDIKPVKAPKTGGRIQREMEALGIKVVWFRPSSKKFNSPGFHTMETRGTIYLNADANMSSVRAKAYHEVFHDIQMFRPEIAQAYSQQVGLAPIYAAGAQYAEGQAESAAKGRADAFARIQAAVAAAGIEGVDVEVPAAVSRIGAARLEQEGQAEAFGPTAARVGGRGVLSPLVRFAARRGLMGREVAGAMSVIDAVARAAAVEKAAGVKPDATLSPLGRTLLWMEDMSVDIPAEIEQASQSEAEQAQPAAAQAPQPQPAGVSMAREPRPLSSFTPEWREWFNDSKVVNRSGNPVLNYHGTYEKFTDIFRTPSFFSENPEEASAYSFAATFARREKRLPGRYRLSKAPSEIPDRVPLYPIIDDIPERAYGQIISVNDAVVRVNDDGNVEIFEDLASGKYSIETGDVVLVRKDNRKRARQYLSDYRRFIDEKFPPGVGLGGRVYPVYLSIKNPVRLNAFEANRLGKRLNEMTDAQIAEYVGNLKSQGYDGIETTSDEASFSEQAREAFGGIPRQWIPFDPSQIKSAFNERPTSAPGISMSRASDADYLSAVKRGDMATVQRMVDEAARASGYNSPRLYKAMPSVDVEGRPITTIQRQSEFPAFNRGEAGIRIAGFFAEDRTVAERFTAMTEPPAPIYETYLREDNPYVIDAAGRMAGDVQFGPSGMEFREAVRSGKYDSIIIRNTADEGTIHVALDPSKIKSADPVTYDEQGNVIPLSKRFDTTTPLISFARPSDADYLAAVERGDMATAQRMVDEAAKAAGYRVGPVYHGTKRRFDKFESKRDAAGLIYFSEDREFAARWPVGFGGHRDPEPDVVARIDAARKASRELTTPLFEKLETEYGSWKNVPDDRATDILEKGRAFERTLLDGMTVSEAQSEMGIRVITAYLNADRVFDPSTQANEFVAEVAKMFGVAEDGLTPDIRKLMNDGAYLIWENPVVVNAVLDKYDAIRLQETSGQPARTIAVRDNWRIKSADPVTYDEQGNVIPLSKRFDVTTPLISFSREGDAEAASLREQIAVLQRQIRDVQNVTAAQRTNAIREVRILERRLLTAERVAEQKTLQATRAKMRVELERDAAKEDMAAADAQIAKLQTRLDSAKASVESLKQELGSLRRGANLEQRLADAEETAQRAIDFAYAIGRHSGLAAGEIEGQRKRRREVQRLTERLGQVGSALEETQATMEEEAAAAQGRIDLAYAIGRREGLVSGQVAGQKQERRVVRKLSERLAIVEERLNTAVPALREARRQIKQDAAAAQRAINFAYGMGLAKGRVQGVMEGRRQVLKRMAQREDTLQRQLFELREMSRMRADQKEQVADAVRRIAADAAKMLPVSQRGVLAVKIANAKTLAQANRIAVDAVKQAADAEVADTIKEIKALRKRLGKRGMTYAARTRVESLLAQAEAGLKTTSGQRLRAAVQAQRGATPVLVNAVDMYSAVVDAAALVEQAGLLHSLDRQQYLAQRAARIARYDALRQDMLNNMSGRPTLAESERADKAATIPFYRRVGRANSDIYTMMQELEGSDAGVLNNLLVSAQAGKGEASLEHASILRQIVPALQAAGYTSIDDYALKNGLLGEASANLRTVRMGGQDVTLPVGTILSVAAMDDETLALFPDTPGTAGQGITFAGAETTKTFYPSRQDIEAIRSGLSAEERGIVDAMKTVLETQIRDRVMDAVFAVEGDQPPVVQNYWPRVRLSKQKGDASNLNATAGNLVRGALTNVGFAQARTGGTEPLVYRDAFQTWERHVQVALDMIHMAQPYRDAATVLTDPAVVAGIDRQFGNGTAEMVLAVFSNGVGATARSNPTIIDKLTNNVTGAVLALRPRTLAKVLVGGQMRLASEIPLGYWSKGVARAASRLRNPLAWDARVEEIHSLNGYFSRRHQMHMRSIISGSLSDADRVRISTAWNSMIDSFRAAGQNLAAAQLTDAAGRFKDASNGANMMIASVVDMLRYMDEQIMLAAVEARLAEIEDEGILTGQDALREAALRAERDFRRTQNASDEFDDSLLSAYNRVKGASGWRIFFPFSSDPVKARNQIRRAFISGDRRLETGLAIGANMAASTIIGAASLATTGYLVSLVAGLFGGDGPSDEEEKEAMEAAKRLPIGVMNEVMSSTLGYLGIVLGWVTSAIEFRRAPFTPIAVRPVEQVIREATGPKPIPERVVAALLAASQFAGFPMYGLYQFVRDFMPKPEREKSSTTKEPQSPRDRLMERIERRRREIERARQGGAAVR